MVLKYVQRAHPDMVSLENVQQLADGAEGETEADTICNNFEG